MKRIFLLFSLLICAFFSNAQTDDKSKALQLVTKHHEAIGITKDQLSNIKVSSTYYNEVAGTQMVYLLQTYKGLTVLNQMLVLAFKNEKLVSNAGTFITDIDKISNYQAASPSLSAKDAVKAAFAEAGIVKPTSLPKPISSDNGRKLDFGKQGAVTENITAELVWVPVEKGNQLSVKLAWQVQVVPADKSDWWNIQIDALTGNVINKFNLTVYESFHKSNDHSLLQRPKENKQQIGLKELKNLGLLTPPPPSVTSADYRVYPIPFESPLNGPTAIVHNPWELSGIGNNATTNGWHFDGTTNYNFTRGNNTFAYLDRAGNNTPSATTNWPDTSTTAIPSLTFTQQHNATGSPYPVQNKKFALNNLFYWNNLMHDVCYQYGFNEISGNFQADNLGRGGNGNDYVQAEAQDGSGNNNANFSTPADGGKPRMQMFIWNAIPNTTFVTVNAPVGIAGPYEAVESAFSESNRLADVGPVTAQVIYYDDAAGGTHEACTGASTSVLTGKIALINRGNCNFTIKVLAAQAAGAVGVIMVNNVAGAPIIMGGGPDNTITIPAVMVTDVTGALIAAQLASGVNATLSGTGQIDGDIDNGIVCHEFGHGISNRLTGGPAVTTCLQNGEQGGEGWSDYFALMMTTDWANAQVTDGVLKPRPMGLYALGNQNLFTSSVPGTGIRNYKYCTDIAVNPLTYASMGVAPIGTEVHNTGEVWAMALWEMTWAIIQQTGINPNLFDATGAGGNSVAMKLVMEGMKLQPCSPGFIDARTAIITADQNLYGGSHLCAIWTAFAKRGMGFGALQGSAGNAADGTASFAMPPAPSVTSQPTGVTVCAGTNATFTITGAGYLPTYNWQVSTDGGVTWNNVSPAVTTATLTLTAVTGSMNNYQYRCQVKGICPADIANSNAATLTVNTASPAITAQPANTSTCVGTTATFSITVTGTNTYNWQVSTDGGTTWNNTVPAETSTTLTLASVTAGMNNNQYRCQVTGGCPTSTIPSNAATLTVTTGSISITTNPANTSVCNGSDASFSVTATGASLTYNWQVSTDGGTTWNNTVPAVTTATLTLNAVTAGMNNNQYRCNVNGPGACTAAGVNSNAGVLTVNNAVSITAQPASASVCTGSDATFSITVSGLNPTYNWQVSTDGGTTWNNVAPAVTTATLTVTGVTSGMNNNQYRCQVGGDCTTGSINSAAATLTTNSPALVTAQPANTAACAGSNATFTITASGTGLTYNWQVSTDGGVTWNNVSPAVTTASISLTAVTAGMNNNQYRCQVAISCNPTGVNSNSATLTVNAAPAVTTQPANTAVCAGADATFCVTATGTGLTYQWQVSTAGCTGPWADIPGATSSCFTATAVSATANGNAYQCIVSGTCTPAVTTACATLTVNTAAAITAQPVNTSGCTGGNATFSVTATGSGLTYNWQVSTDGGVTWNNVSPAATTATLTLTNVTAAMTNNQYRCQVGGSCSAGLINSNAAVLSLSNSITFSTQPVSAGVCAGTDVTFTVAASGTGLAYNWQVSTDGGTTWNNVAPANTTNTLNITAPTVSMSGNQYRCVASGDCNPSGVNSDVATLTVNTSVTLTSQPADVDGCNGNVAVFTVTATGSSITYQWQVSVNGGPFTDLTNTAPYSGVNTNTLTITNPSTILNGTRYRLNASGAPCGGIVTSNNALLKVNQTPVVVLTAASFSTITPYIRTTLFTTVSPAGNYSYQWYREGVLVPSLTSDRFSVMVDDLGTYEVVVTDNATGCSSRISNKAAVEYASSSELFIYPNPSSGSFQVRYFSSSNTARTLNIYDSKGARVFQKAFTITSPYTKMDVNMDNAASDVYLVELRDADGNRIATGKVVIR